MLRQSIHDLAIVHDARRQSLERLPHICMFFLAPLVFVLLFGSFHHAEHVLYGRLELARN